MIINSLQHVIHNEYAASHIWIHSNFNSFLAISFCSQYLLIDIDIYHYQYCSFLYSPLEKFLCWFKYVVFRYPIDMVITLSNTLYSKRPRAAGFRLVNPTERWPKNLTKATGFTRYFTLWGDHASTVEKQTDHIEIPFNLTVEKQGAQGTISIYRPFYQV